MRNRSIVSHPRHPHVFYAALAEFQKEQARVYIDFFGPPLTCDLSNEYDLSEPFTETNDLVMDLAISVISQAGNCNSDSQSSTQLPLRQIPLAEQPCDER
jgi:hypothetical protein